MWLRSWKLSYSHVIQKEKRLSSILRRYYVFVTIRAILCFSIISMFLRVLRASLNLQTLLLPRFYRRSLLLLDFNLLSKRKGIVTLKISTSRTDLASFLKRILVRLRRVCFLIKNENSFLHRWNGYASTYHESAGAPCSCMFSAILLFFFFYRDDLPYKFFEKYTCTEYRPFFPCNSVAAEHQSEWKVRRWNDSWHLRTWWNDSWHFSGRKPF